MQSLKEGMLFTVQHQPHNNPYLIEQIFPDKVRVSWDHGYGYSRAHYTMNVVLDYFKTKLWVLCPVLVPDIDWDTN